jgi:Escherichia/Staphylococcus phage prohead protease
MKRELERRRFPMELRLTRENGAPKLDGHIAVFNQLSDDLGGFREKIAPGAFKVTIAQHDIRALWNHDSDLVLGRNKAGTLELEEDDIGLLFRNDPPDTTWFKDRMVSLERKDVTGCSFGFYTDEDEWGTEPDGTRVRTLRKVTLVEVSPGVTFPAYPQTDVALRSMEVWDQAHAAPPPELGSGQPESGMVEIELRTRRLRLQRLAL